MGSTILCLRSRGRRDLRLLEGRRCTNLCDLIFFIRVTLFMNTISIDRSALAATAGVPLTFDFAAVVKGFVQSFVDSVVHFTEVFHQLCFCLSFEGLQCSLHLQEMR